MTAMLYRHERSRGQAHYFVCESSKCVGGLTLRANAYNSPGGRQEGREDVLKALEGMSKEGASSRGRPSAIVQNHREKVAVAKIFPQRSQKVKKQNGT